MTYPKNCSKLVAVHSRRLRFRTWTWGRDSLSTSSSSCFLTNISFMFVVVAVAAACKWNFCQFSLFAWDRERWWGGGLEGDGTQQTTLKVTSEPFNLSWHSQQILLPVCGMKIFFYFFLLFLFFLCKEGQWNGTIKFNGLSIVKAIRLKVNKLSNLWQ